MAIFTIGSCLGNPGATGVGAVIFKNGLNKPAIKLTKAVLNSCKTYHGEALFLALKYIKSLSTPHPFNNIHIFSGSTAALNAIISPTLQDLHSNIIEEIKRISNSIEAVTILQLIHQHIVKLHIMKKLTDWQEMELAMSKRYRKKIEPTCLLPNPNQYLFP